MGRLRDGLVAMLALAVVPPICAAAAMPTGCPTVPEGLYPESAPLDGDIPWNRWLRDCVPPLTHDRAGRWPLVFWHGPQWEGVSDDDLKAFAARGMVPTVRLDPADITRALRLQKLGLPVIALEGKDRAWPYSLGGDPAGWTLDLPTDAELPAHWRREPDPLRLDLWAKGADQLRQVLAAFKAAGVRLDAAWLDYEGQPSVQDYDALLASTSARAKVPAAALASPQAFHAYRRQLWIQLMSAYVAAPIREFYPAISVTNWIAMLSSPVRPVLSWDNWRQPDLSATLFTATNPVAYGIDSAFWHVWPKGQAPEQASVDRAYLHLLLRQPSADAANRMRKAPYLPAIPWVARWVRDLGDKRTPMMSRAAYREALRHLWLRGTGAMQVFNPLRQDQPAESLAEVQDAVAVYDEMLDYADLLGQGEVMNFMVPAPDAQGLLWSGSRTGQKAVVRVFPLGSEAPKFLRLTIWPGEVVVLPVSPGGASFRIERRTGGEPPQVTSD